MILIDIIDDDKAKLVTKKKKHNEIAIYKASKR